MDKQIITFTANEQALARTGECHYSAHKVSYIEAHFELGQNWDGFDSVRAVWWTDFVKGISTVLDSDGVCIVPSEVLKRKAKVNVNLVGSIVDDDVVTDRLTSYPVVALCVDADTKVDGTETAEITPNQFEQYVAAVRELVESVKDIDHIEMNADYTLTIYYSDGTSYTTDSIRGEQGEQGEDGNGIESAVLNADYTLTLNFTDGTSYTTTSIRGEQGPQGEPAVIPWDDILPQDTASGTIASFPDGTDLLPCKSLSVELEPIQDLNGYDKPWSGGNGANLLDLDKATFNSGGAYGLTVSRNGDYITVSGTASQSGALNFNVITGYADTSLSGKGYVLQAFDLTSGYTINNCCGFRTESEKSFAISLADITQGQNVNCSFRPSVAKTSRSTWTPYSNLCPISGRTECVTSISPYEQTERHTITGKNIYNAPNNTSSVLVPCHIENGQAVTASCASSGAGIRYYNADQEQIDYWTLTQQLNGRYYKTFTASGGIEYVRFYGATSSKYMIELGATPSDYEPYGYSYTTTLGRTVYGGTLDVVSGELVVDTTLTTYDGTETGWGYSSSSGKNYFYLQLPTTVRANWTPITNMFKGVSNRAYSELNDGEIALTYAKDYINIRCDNIASLADFKSMLGNTNLTIVYKLATPQTYQLTPTEVELLKGDNNVWSDGEVEVEYYADIQLWVEKKLG